ncbi:MAG: 50S ribosomal protein L23 [Lentisphaerae bacterium]|nr:50S ribosomal protein L23 [Lentisphaerota bacterium]
MKHQTGIIRRIQMTEKASTLSSTKNQYFFEVEPDANKLEIKRAVEDLYKVKVAHVNTMRYIGKSRRERTANFGKRSDWKRAVVTLVAGNQIDLT